MEFVTVSLSLLLLFVAPITADFDLHHHLLSTPLKQSRDGNNLAPIIEGLGGNKETLPHEANAEFWLNLAGEEVAARVAKKHQNLNKAKNIILFLGDGMSLSTATAARILKGQRKGNTGEEDALSFENFPYFGLSKTYCANAQVPDSACTATAYLCGVKANIVTIGVTANVNFGNCTESSDPANQVSSIADWAQKAGKATGFITTTTLTHASPAGAYAHTASRSWECDSNVPADNDGCTDIAQQLIYQEPGRNFDLMMGGGAGKFVPKHLRDLHGNMGERNDGKNLLAAWQGQHPRGLLVHNRNSLLSLNVSRVSHILGIFQSSYMDYHALSDKQKQPTLTEMTEVALKFLSQKSDKGYFVFIEGGRIDTAHHSNMAGLSLDETLEFDKAIQKARDMTNPDDTLIVVTADHSHPLSIAGYPGRGSNILGLNDYDKDLNGLKYTTLNYAAGSDQYLDDQGQRLGLEGKFGENLSVPYSSYIKREGGAHGGDDVAIYASGPHEHLFRGVMEQHTIPHLMAYAACIGEGPTMCDNVN